MAIKFSERQFIMKHHLLLLLAYNVWANRRVLDAVTSLTSDEWTRDLGSSFPNVQSTTAHLIGVEWIWLERWQGRSPSSVPEWMNDPSSEQLQTVWEEIATRRSEMLNTDDFRRKVSYRLFNGTEGNNSLENLVLHVVNHSSYHRGQLATMLRQLGKQPPATDLLVYLQQNK
jgi:uncharacterized damage-inducible protein DinB